MPSRSRSRFARGPRPLALDLARCLTIAAIAGVALISLGLAAAPARALSNGDFGAGLAGWSTTGPVTAVDGELVLRDDGPAWSGAWQLVETAAPRTIIEFDLLADLSDFVPSDPFGFADLFSASLYLIDDPTGFTPSTPGSASALTLLSADWIGVFDAAADVGPAARGGSWLHVMLEFDSPSAWIAPSFELFELALVGGDSEVRIDDVSVTPVPEPGTAVLLALGLGVLARRASRMDLAGGRSA